MKQLINYLEKNKMPSGEEIIEKFDAYRSGILQWNEFVNLTAIRDPEEFTVKHFIDSAACFSLPEYQAAETLLDLGTGAGFPGVPLAILSPEKNFVLVDSLNKRLRIIDELCQSIGIKNVKTVHGRAEDLGRETEHREKYDMCVSRAVANLATLSEYCLPFVKRGGYMAAYKGADGENELEEAMTAIGLLGGKFDRWESTPVDAACDRHKIILVKKVNKTKSKYPRKAGSPSKEPLK